MTRPVLVGFDRGDSSVAVLEYAAGDALRRDAPLLLVHALRPPTPALGTIDLIYEDPAATADARERLRVAADAVSARHPWLRTETCVVTVVPGRTDGRSAVGPVVVGIDGSPSSQGVLAAAFEEARMRLVPLTVVLVWWSAGADEPSAVRRLEDSLAGWPEKYPQTPVHPLLRHGLDPAAELEDVAGAQMARLIVVGSRGHGRLAGLLLGSVSRGLLARADRPVQVVRPTTGRGHEDGPEPDRAG